MFFNGKKVSSIDTTTVSRLEPCSWHTCDDFGKNIPSDYTGYLKDKIVHDNCRTMYLRSLQKWDKTYVDKCNEWNKFKEDLTTAITIFKTLLTNIKTKDNLVSEHAKYKKTLKDGFKYKKIHGNKVKVPIDEIEIEKLTTKVKNLEKPIVEAEKKLKTQDKDIYTVIKLTHTYNTQSVKRLNFIWNNYKDTISKWNNYKILHDKIIEKIDNYDDIYDEFMDDLATQEITMVKEKRTTRHKTTYYIDENGNKIELNNKVEQTIIHK